MRDAVALVGGIVFGLVAYGLAVRILIPAFAITLVAPVFGYDVGFFPAAAGMIVLNVIAGIFTRGTSVA